MEQKIFKLRRHGGFNIKEVPADKMIAAYASHLKEMGKMRLPDWVDVVKTGFGKNRMPVDPDWYFIRAASILRKIYIRPGCGVGRIRKIYSTNQRRGVKPNRYSKGSGKVARTILQQFEVMDFLEPGEDGVRRLTSAGRRDLDQIATSVGHEL